MASSNILSMSPHLSPPVSSTSATILTPRRSPRLAARKLIDSNIQTPVRTTLRAFLLTKESCDQPQEQFSLICFIFLYILCFIFLWMLYISDDSYHPTFALLLPLLLLHTQENFLP